jgi:ribokinase
VTVGHVPAVGEIVHSKTSWEEVAGDGAVAAMQLAKMADACLFFTAVGDDSVGEKSVAQLEQCGVEVYATKHKQAATREVYVYIDSNNERTITVSGSIKPTDDDESLPWHKLAEMDAVFFVSGDALALTAARKAKVLVSTARILPLLQSNKTQLDALVCSHKDKGEKYKVGDINPEPSLIVRTNGAFGGNTEDGVAYAAQKINEDEVYDTYGYGDSFGAGIAFALGSNLPISVALNVAASCGADAAKRRGAFGNG